MISLKWYLCSQTILFVCCFLEYPRSYLSHFVFCTFSYLYISAACTKFILRYYIYNESNILVSTTSEGNKMKIFVSVTIYAGNTRTKHRIGRIKNILTIGRTSGQQRNQRRWALIIYRNRTKANIGAEWTLPQVRLETPEFNWQW